MKELLNEKLVAITELKSFTKEIMSISLKTDYDKFNLMIDERVNYINKINIVHENIIKKAESNKGLNESNEIQILKKEIKTVLNEIAQMDNLIRKNINNELKSIKKTLNQPELESKLNIKA